MLLKKAVLFFICLLYVFQSNNRCFGQELGVKQIIWTTEWSPDGAYFAYAGNIDSIKIYKSSDYSLFRSIAVKNTVVCTGKKIRYFVHYKKILQIYYLFKKSIYFPIF